MACFSPMQAWQPEAGGPAIFYEKAGHRPVLLPCGHCVGCHLERSRQWAVRCVHEAQMHEQNSFVTLTYSDAHVPELGSLQYRDFQLFMKRLRKEMGHARFFVAGEYGERLARPHYHALLFGVGFPDKVYYRTLASGSRIYTSRNLERLWPWGFSSIGDVTFESAAYVARYVLKKIPLRGLDHDKHYASRVPEFCRMSLKPGIGAGFYDRYRTDVYPNGEIVSRGGFKSRAPRYYDKLYRNAFPSEFEDLQFKRQQNADSFLDDTTPERLRVREIVAKRRLSFSKDSL